MAIDDDTESCSSKAFDFSPKTPRNHQQLKLEVFNDVLHRLQDSGCHDAKLPGFDDQLWLHFNRLPARYFLHFSNFSLIFFVALTFIVLIVEFLV